MMQTDVLGSLASGRSTAIADALCQNSCMLRHMPLLRIVCGTLILSSCLPYGDSSRQVDSVMSLYSEVEPVLQQLVEEKGIQGAVTHLEEALHNHPELEDVCHGLSHVIGEAAYERYGFEESLRIEQDICGSGYVHGVVESYLVGVPDIASAIQTLCPEDSGKCFHGIGHGLMDRSENDLPRSLALCDTLSTRSMRIQCAEGVFMENVDADFLSHPTEYLREDDPYFPCRDRGEIYEGVCALYAPRYFLRLHPKAYREAIAWCETIPEKPRDACMKGIGDVAIKQNIADPLFVEELCDEISLDRRHFCIEGLTSYYIVHHAAASKGQELCAVLREENRAACEKAVVQSRRFYPR